MMDGVSQVSCRSTIEFNPAINAQTTKKKILVDLTDNAMAMWTVFATGRPIVHDFLWAE